MKQITRTITKYFYSLGTIEMEKGEPVVKNFVGVESLKPLSDRAAIKRAKDLYGDSNFVVLEENAIQRTYSMPLEKFVEEATYEDEVLADNNEKVEEE